MTALMPPSAVDAGEQARLRAVQAALGQVGLAPEERFDRITRLAQRLFGVPIAAVTLVDRDRQLVKSQVGFPHESTARTDAFCNITIAGTGATVIEDAHLDQRFVGNAFVEGEPYVRFYAGYPLRTNGQPVGALCVLDSTPRALDDAQLAILRELASWAESELNSRAEMDRAAEVQQAMLPHSTALDADGYRITGACWPARSVGGDFLDWYRTPDGDLVSTLGDVMGKGIGAALMAATVRSVMRTAGREHEPSVAMSEAAQALDADLNRSGTLVTLCHSRITPRTGRMLAVDAGHGLTVTVRADGTTVRTQPGGSLPLGILPGETWPETEVFLEPGDTVISFSDGLLDLFDGVEETFAHVVEIATAEPDRIVDLIGELISGAPLDDDVTVQVVRRCP